MRMTLKNYLDMDGVTINATAQTMGTTRESIRRWRDNKNLDVLVVFDPATDKISHIELNQTKIIKAKS